VKPGEGGVTFLLIQVGKKGLGSESSNTYCGEVAAWQLYAATAKGLISYAKQNVVSLIRFNGTQASCVMCLCAGAGLPSSPESYPLTWPQLWSMKDVVQSLP
jgi:hypothetical protein